MDVAAFRTTFPEFGTSPGLGAFADARVTFWLSMGAKLLNASRWGDMLDYGLALFTAHHLAIDNRARAEASGVTLGQVQGPISAKSVDKVSVSYDTGAVTLETAGHWNLTVYGVQFWQMVRMFGAGPVHVW